MTKIEPVPIILVTYKRLHFLKKTIEYIYNRTLYPHQVFVVNNGIDDNETIRYLKVAKLQGYIYDYTTLPKNNGLASGFSAGFEYIKNNNKSEWIITTQDDILCPDLRPCWLEHLIHLMKKYPNYAGIALRIQRVRRRDVDEHKDLIESSTACPSVFRISKKSDIIDMGSFGSRPHWESTSFVEKVKNIKKKVAMSTHLYADHIGFVENKGFKSGYKSYFTYAENKETQHIDQPYPKIDPKTNIPLTIVSSRDRDEQNRREDYYKYWGIDYKDSKNLLKEQIFLSKYAEKGRGIDLGCGHNKCHSNAIGVDIFPFKSVDIIADARDLWMFKDNELDFIIATHILEHMPDVKSALKEWKRVLKPGGVLAIAVPDGEAHPKWLCSTGHKINLGPINLKILLKRILGMKLLKIGIVPDKKGGRCQTAYAVAVKRKK